MDSGQLKMVLRHLRRFDAVKETGGLSDAELLDRFATRHDEAAFEVLVWRHGKMVLGVCRRILRNVHSAEDAFQATFLALVRKARSIRNRESLGAWLYRVAYRVALQGRARATTRARHEKQAPRAPDSLPNEAADWRDVRPVLDEEINRLPGKYRRAVILCYLDGRTTEDAAGELGCPKGTILSRLAWARERLRLRLSRRGVVLSASLLATVFAEKGIFAKPASGLVGSTVKAAFLFSTGNAAGVISTEVVSLTQGVLKAMFMTKVKIAGGVVLLLVALGIGGLWSHQPANADSFDAKKDEVVRQSAAQAEEKAVAKAREGLRPLGDWEREIGPIHGTLHVEGDRIRAIFKVPEDLRNGAKSDKKIDIVVEADYSVTKDSVLYGVLTGVEVKGGADVNERAETEAEIMAQFTDMPFCFRLRLDDNVLTIKGLKFAANEKMTKGGLGEVPQFLMGRYKRQTPASTVYGVK